MAYPVLQSNELKDGDLASAARPVVAGLEPYRSLVRLLIGLALIGRDDLLARLREWEDTHPPEPVESEEDEEWTPTGGASVRTMVELAFEAADLTARTVLATAGTVRSTLRPVTQSRLLRALRAPVDSLAAAGRGPLPADGRQFPG